MDIQLTYERVEDLMNDFTLFHPSPTQIVIIYDLGSRLAEKLGIKVEVVRTVCIKAIIQHQIEFQNFHFVNESILPQFKLSRSQKINERIVQAFVELMDSPSMEDVAALRLALEEVFEVYLQKYASREPSRDL